MRIWLVLSIALGALAAAAPTGRDEPGRDEPGRDEPGRDEPGRDEPGREKYEQPAAAAMDVFAGWGAARLLSETAAERHLPEALAGDRVLLWSSNRASPRKTKKAILKTVGAFDDVFDPDARAEGAPARRTAVLFEFTTAEGLASLADYLGQQDERLAGWSLSARAGVGFSVDDPLCACWLTEVEGGGVWNAENELVNRLARLLTLERFGQLPYWLEMGLAWHVELAACKDVYCFPYRSGFVSKKEHERWDRKFAQVVDARGERPVSFDEIARWPRSTWHDELSPLAWGAVMLLAKHYEDELPALGAAFERERRETGRDVQPDGS